MTTSTPGPMDPGALQKLYAAHFNELADIACSEYAIPRDEAEQLAEDAFTAGLRHLGKVPDPHQWLVAAVRDAARRHANIEDKDEHEEK
jgi:hypothetical protein